MRKYASVWRIFSKPNADLGEYSRNGLVILLFLLVLFCSFAHAPTEKCIRTLEGIARLTIARGVTCPHDVEDILQDLLLDFHRAKVDLKNVEGAYVRGAATNKKNEFHRYRYQKRRDTRRVNPEHSLDDLETGKFESTLDVDAFVDALPLQARTILRMRLDGFTLEEIAESEDIGEKSVRRILKLLQCSLSHSRRAS